MAGRDGWKVTVVMSGGRVASSVATILLCCCCSLLICTLAATVAVDDVVLCSPLVLDMVSWSNGEESSKAPSSSGSDVSTQCPWNLGARVRSICSEGFGEFRFELDFVSYVMRISFIAHGNHARVGLLRVS